MKKIIFLMTMLFTALFLVSCDTLEISSFSVELKEDKNLVLFEKDELFELKMLDGNDEVLEGKVTVSNNTYRVPNLIPNTSYDFVFIKRGANSSDPQFGMVIFSIGGSDVTTKVEHTLYMQE